MTTPGQAPVASVAEAVGRSHFALRRAVVDVAPSENADAATIDLMSALSASVEAASQGGPA